MVEGFKEGFDINCSLESLSQTAKNHESIVENSDIVQELLNIEIESGRIKGPFTEPPFPEYHVSPIKLVPKKTPGKYRMILNLSYPYDGMSVNANIASEHCSVQYASIQDAISKIQEVGPGCYMAKSDIESAFRIVPVSADCHKFLSFKFQGKFYYDTCLAMGASCVIKYLRSYPQLCIGN